ncbi:MAG: sigma-70 family RNA polymerase sigma factor [Clostridia bacterium]|nr:sigma-70 family RNA polymerase sigma factor [Clostridia bacterium]
MDNEELVSLIQQGTDVSENLGLLYQQNESFIRSVCRKFSKVADIDDLMQEAFFALKDTVEKHDPNREDSSFLGHLKLYVQNRCLRYSQKQCGQFSFHDMGNTVRLYRQLEDRTGRTPDKQTVMTELKLSEKQYDSLMLALNMFNTIDLDMKISVDNGDEATLADKVDSGERIEDDLIAEELNSYCKEVLWKQVKELDITKQNIIFLIYKLELKQEDIAMNLGIDAKTVAFHKGKALKQLKQMKKIQELAEMYDYDCSLAYRTGLQKCLDGKGSNVENLAIKRIEFEEQFRKKQNKVLKLLKGDCDET